MLSQDSQLSNGFNVMGFSQALNQLLVEMDGEW